MKTYVIGDIHARLDALQEVLKKASFDKDIDTLIILGDIADGGFNTSQVIDELLTIQNIIFITGNHDQWFIDYTFKGRTPKEWINQGGANTLNSYGGNIIPSNKSQNIDVNGVRIPKKHVEFFANRLYYYENDNMLFVHGGFDPSKTIDKQDLHLLMWDRDLIKYADNNIVPNYDKVFIGHTTTQHIERDWVNYKCRSCKHEWEKEVKTIQDMKGAPVCEKCKSKNIFQSLGCVKPLKIGNLFCLDTGAGWDGKLTIMDINSEEYWQSGLQVPAITNKTL